MLLFTFISLFIFGNDELESIRDQYHTAAVDHSKIKKLESTCKLVDPNDPATKGYCAMVHFLIAKNAISPYKKLTEFNKGKRLLDSLIAEDQQNIELRYMRHSIQDRAPGFLGYNDQLAKDENFMSTKLKSISDSSKYDLIYNYLNNTNE